MNLIDYMTDQYELVRQAREVLINYCKKISPEDFISENTGFGRGGSIRNLTVHIANVYEFWIGKHALRKKIEFTDFKAISHPNALDDLFEIPDTLMNEFFKKIKLTELKKIDYDIRGKKGSVTPIKLFTHVITHEFHHKGQILSISRQLGYTPVDSDIIR